MSLNNYKVFSKEKSRIKNGQHIFYDIVKRDYSLLADSNKLQFYYYFFAQIEECLTYTRSKYYSLAYKKIQDLKKNILTYSPNDDNITSIYLPMVAYYKLSQGEFQESIDCLKESIGSLGKVEESGTIEAKEAIFEQHLNICRVHFKSEKITKGVLESLILFEERFIYNNDEDFWEEYFEYFIQSILLSIIEKPDSFSINHIYTFIREIHDKSKNNGIIYFPQLLALNIFLNVNMKELKRRALTDNNISNFMKMLIILNHAKKNKDNYSKKLYRDLFEEISSNKIISVDKFRKLSQVFQIDKLWYV